MLLSGPWKAEYVLLGEATAWGAGPLVGWNHFGRITQLHLALAFGRALDVSVTELVEFGELASTQ